MWPHLLWLLQEAAAQAQLEFVEIDLPVHVEDWCGSQRNQVGAALGRLSRLAHLTLTLHGHGATSSSHLSGGSSTWTLGALESGKFHFDGPFFDLGPPLEIYVGDPTKKKPIISVAGNFQPIIHYASSEDYW